MTNFTLTAAGAVSPPVLLAQKWTNGREKGRYSTIGLGVLVGTLFLPILAPWGIYKLFKRFYTILPKKVDYWINRWNGDVTSPLGKHHYENGSVEFKIPESIVINTDRAQVYSPDLGVPSTSQLVTPDSHINVDWSNVSDQEDVNEAQVERVKAFLEGLEYNIGHFDKVEEYYRECWLNEGQEVLSDVEDDDGRLDTQLLCVRKVVSDTFVNAKTAEVDFNMCEFAAGLCSSRCLINQRPHEVSQASRGKDTDGTLKGGKSPGNLEENFSEAQITTQVSDKSCAPLNEDVEGLPEMRPKDQVSDGSGAPLCTDTKDLPEKGPKKKAKRRRRKRTGEQVSTRNHTSSTTGEDNDTSHSNPTTLLLQQEDKETERATEVQEDKEITPEKKLGKTGNAAREANTPSTNQLVTKNEMSEILRINGQFELKPSDEPKRCLYMAHFNHID